MLETWITGFGQLTKFTKSRITIRVEKVRGITYKWDDFPGPALNTFQIYTCMEKPKNLN